MPDMQDFAAAVIAGCTPVAFDTFYTRQDEIFYFLESFGDQGEQMARVGSPEPSESICRRQRTGIGGVGNK